MDGLHPLQTFLQQPLKDSNLPPPPTTNKRPYFLYDRPNDAVLSQIASVIAEQHAIGFGAVFDQQSAAAGLQNLSYITVSTDVPCMTYVFDCVSVDPIEVLHSIRSVLTDVNILKIVYDVNESLGYFYQRHYLEMQGVMDLSVMDLTLRPDEEKTAPSLEKLIQVYVDSTFKVPEKVAEDEESAGEWGDTGMQGAKMEAEVAAAALEGAFLLDVFRAQQQAQIGFLTKRLGEEARAKLAVIYNGGSPKQQ